MGAGKLIFGGIALTVLLLLVALLSIGIGGLAGYAITQLYNMLFDVGFSAMNGARIGSIVALLAGSTGAMSEAN